jgi:uncharacterized protein YjiS (DUF1127 family)
MTELNAGGTVDTSRMLELRKLVRPGLSRAERHAEEAIGRLTDDHPRVLYHYTNAHGLLGILERQELWATHFRFVNDASEVHYGWNLFVSVAKRYAALLKNEHCIEFVGRIIQKPSADWWTFDAYVACFCEDGDLLSQWRGYTQSGDGYAIGFDLSTFANQHHPHEERREAALFQVVYDQRQQRRAVRGLLRLALQVLADIPAGTTPEDATIAIADVVRFFNVRLTHLLVSFKDPAFAAEQEWRLCTIEYPFVRREVRFRTGPYGITPFVAINARKDGVGLLPVSRTPC